MKPTPHTRFLIGSLQALIDVPYIPLGQMLQATAFSNKLTGVLNGFPLFWNVRRT